MKKLRVTSLCKESCTGSSFCYKLVMIRLVNEFDLKIITGIYVIKPKMFVLSAQQGQPKE